VLENAAAYERINGTVLEGHGFDVGHYVRTRLGRNIERSVVNVFEAWSISQKRFRERRCSARIDNEPSGNGNSPESLHLEGLVVDVASTRGGKTLSS
jgi:hypothetical protein